MKSPGEKLVIQLWETLVDKGVGSLLTPWKIKRDGKARNELRRDELLMLAQAENDAAEIRAGRAKLRDDGTLLRLPPPAVDLDDGMTLLGPRIEPHLGLPAASAAAAFSATTDAARHEINTAKAILFAEDQLAGDEQAPPDRKIDDDWLFSWRDYAGRVSNEQLQRMWGGILAGELKSPGSHSLRTLEFLKGLSQGEATMLATLAQFVVEGCLVRSQKEYLKDHGLPFGMLLKLQELGVLSGVEALGLSVTHTTIVQGRFLKALVSHDKVLLVEHADEAQALKMEVYMLTGVGREVLSLGSFKGDEGYLRAVGKEIAARGFRVQLARLQQVKESEGTYYDPVPIEAEGDKSGSA